MIYKCTTPGCLNAESNAPFAAAINCPVCQQALVAETIEVKVSEKEMDLIMALPYVIAYPLKRTLEEQNYWKKINYFKLIYAINWNIQKFVSQVLLIF